MSEIPTRYDFSAAEERIYKRWLEAKAFAARPDERENRYVIMMPLPNVTGALHIGHAMDNLMQDLLIRWHRMMGDNTLWMPGTDHAGIATQAVVEKRLFELEGQTRQDIGREALVQRIFAWKDEYQARIIQQLQRLGCSCDWDRVRFTMDPVCTRAVRVAFFRLFQDGLIFRGDRLVNWDCQLQTVISDDEIVYDTVQGHFWHIRYPIIDPEPGEPTHVEVATTRPETMLGDTAVACHPHPAGALEGLERSLSERITSASRKERQELEQELEQVRERRRELLPQLEKLTEMARAGRKVMLPLMEREIPLILDEWAKPELGSGCVKVTPGHDPNDYDVWTRHRDEIDIINILNPNGSLNANVGAYADLDRMVARERVVEDLERKGLLARVEDREIELGHSDRSRTPIEPYLSKQWFIRMGDLEGYGILCGRGSGREFRSPGLAQAAIDAIDPGWQSPSGRRLTFFPDPERYGGTYRSWLAEKRDWCISRQLWWGHRIPIWCGSFELRPLKERVASLTPLRGDDVWALVVDGEGRLHDLERLEQLEAEGSYELLVCLLDQKAEEAWVSRLGEAGLEQDPDVLDTWFSSSLWPFSTLGWPDARTAQIEPGASPMTEDGQDLFSYYYPGSCLVTARDIITLWVARMLMMGLYLNGDVPFTDCFIHANIQDGKGVRMSKSKGNGIDPVDIIDEYGTDAMRYVICDMQTGTQDIRLPLQAISPYTGEPIDLATAEHGRTVFTYKCPKTGKEFDVLGTIPELPLGRVKSDRFDAGRNFCTKLWNFTRLALMNLEDRELRRVSLDELQDEDRWILLRLSKTIRTVTEQLRAYNPSASINAAREFFWSELCDWYAELIKPRLQDEATAPAARSVLALATDQVLRLFHPFVPYVTETLWEKLNEQCPERGLSEPLAGSELLIHASWPEPQPEWEAWDKEADIDLMREVIRAIRDLRSRYGVPPKKPVEVVIKAAGRPADCLGRLGHLVRHMANLSSLDVAPDAERPRLSVTQVIGETEIFVTGILDPDKERARLEGQLEKLGKECSQLEATLANEGFTSRAPAEVVESKRKRLEGAKAELSRIEENLRLLGEA